MKNQVAEKLLSDTANAILRDIESPEPDYHTIIDRTRQTLVLAEGAVKAEPERVRRKNEIREGATQ